MKNLLALFVSCFLFSAAANAAPLTPQDKADLARVETYMNAMPPVRAEFVQQTSDGQVFNGQFWLQRPGRLRFEYAPPNNNFVVADGAFIHFWDAKMHNATDAPIGQTLADFILKDHIAFDSDVIVTGVTRQSGLLNVTLVQSADPNAGSLTLVFENQPLQLRQWTVADPTGRTSNVSLVNPVAGDHFDPRLFVFNPPKK
jgi:outer membrane lipoprotein-sorting protein